MRIFTLRLLLALAALAFSFHNAGAQCLSGIYTIGGASPSYSTFNAAVSDLVSNGVCGPVTFLVRDGIYNEQVTIPAITGASATNTITFQGENGPFSNVDVQFASASSSAGNDNYVLMLDGADHTRFRYLDLERTGSGTFGNVVYLTNNADHNVLEYCDLQTQSLLFTSGTKFLIYSSNTNDNFNSFLNNNLIDGSAGVYMSGSSSGTETGTVVVGNNFIGQRGEFARFYNSSDITLADNTMSSLSNYTYHTSVDIANCSGQLNILRNKMIKNYGVGIYLSNCVFSTASPALIASNFIKTGSASASASGITFSSVSNADIYFNSIFLNAVYSTTGLDLNSASGVRFKNNIISGGSTSIKLDASSTGFISDYNNIKPVVVTRGTSTYTSLSSWTTASGQDANSLSYDPLFQSATDLHLVNNIDLDGKALPVAGVTLDIDGQPRDPLTPDIGADEFTPQPDNAKLLRTDLAFPVCPGNTPVNVKIRNVGSNAITSMNIKWKVNNVMQPAVAWTGNIASGDSSAFTLAGSYTFMRGQVYDVKIWTDSVNNTTDPQASNDTIAFQNGKTKMEGVFTVGGLNPDYPTFAAAVTDLVSRGVCAPVTVNVRNGVYNEQVNIGPVKGASASSRITFQSENLDSTLVKVIHPITYSGNNYTLSMNGARYVTFRKMTLARGPQQQPGYYQGVVVEITGGARHNIIEGNILESSPIVPVNPMTTMAIVYATGSNNAINDSNAIVSNVIRNGSYGIYYFRSSSTTSPEYGLVIKDNVLKDQTEGGIFVSNHRQLTITGNWIRSRRDTLTPGAYCAIQLYNGTASFQVMRNRVDHITGTGVNITGSLSLVASPSSIINNFVANRSQALNITGSQNINVYHNSFDSRSASSAMLVFSTSTGIVLKNNIFSKSNGGQIFSGTTAGITSDYNDLFTTGNISSSHATLAAWQGTGNDINSVSVAPGYLSSTDLHVLSNAALDGLGQALGILTDIDSDPRSASAPDMGADEIIAAPVYDIGVLSLVQPSGTVCHGSPYVKASFKNYSSSPADTIRSFYAYLEVNGTVTDTLPWQGLLVPGDTLEELTVATYQFQYGTPYQVRVWTSHPNFSTDANSSNDTVTLANAITPMGGVYAIGGYRPDFNHFSEAISALHTLGVCDSVIFEVRPGLYPEVLVLNSVPGASSINTITLISEARDSSSVVLAPPNQWTTQVVMNNADHFRFRKMKYLRNTPYMGFNVFSMINSDNLVIEGNHIEGDVNSSGSNNNIVKGNYFFQGHISYIGLSGSGNNNQILNNRIYNEFNDTIINVRWQTDVLVKGNYLVPVWHAGAMIGMVSCTGGSIIGNKLNNIHVNNGLGLTGIVVQNSNGAAVSPILVANNFVNIDDLGTNMVATGLLSINSNYVDFYHNSVLLDRDAGGVTFKAVNGGNINLANNLLLNMQQRPNYFGGSGIQVNNINVLGTVDHNLYIDTQRVAIVNNQDLSLSQWQALSGKDLSSVVGYPSFLPDSIFYNYESLTVSFGNGSGLPYDFTPLELDQNDLTPFRSPLFLPSVATDIHNEPRDMSGPVIGADEYFHFNHNASVLALAAPTDHPCPGNQPVTVTIANYGLQTLTSLDLNWTVDGAPQPVYHWTGSLNSDDSLAVTIGNYSFTAYDSIRIKVWSELPNGNADGFTLLDTVSVNLRTALAGVYTIGGVNPDFTTFGEAVNALHFKGVCSPVIFNVRSGTYTEQLQIREIPGASSVNTITFRSEALDSTAAVLQYNTVNLSNLGNYVVFLNGTDHLRFHKLTVRNLNTQSNSYRRVIWLDNMANDIQVTNCIVESQFIPGSGFTSADAVISAEPEYFGSPLNNNLYIANNIIRNGTIGVYVEGYHQLTATYSSGVKVVNNTITGQVSDGINLISTRAPVIEGNHFSTSNINNSYNLYGIVLTGGLDSFRVVGNIIDSSAVGGIMINNCYGTSSVPGIVANNSVSVSHPAWFNSSAVAISWSGNVKVYHNSIHSAGNNPGSNGIYFENNTGGIDVKNNMIVNSAGGYAVYSSFNSPNAIQADYNNLFTTGATFGYNSGPVASFAAWQTSTGGDLNSISLDPSFASVDDLHFLNFLADDKGTPAAGIVFDLDGNLRSATAPDIGCYEVTLASAATDAAAAAVTAPASQFCAAQMPVAATIQNTGSNIMYGADVNWSVNNIIQPVYQWSGVLQPSAYSPVLALGNYYFTAGTHIVKVWTSSPNGFADPNPVNDTVAFTVTALQHPVSDLGPDTAFCSGGQVVLNPGAFSSYQWSTGTTSSTLTVTNTGTYSVMVTDAFGCMDSDTISVVVNPLPPTPAITFNAGVLTSSAATGNQWLFNNNPIPGATGQTHAPTQSGSYKVIVTNSFGCTSQSTAYIYYVGIEENEIAYFSVYPIPATGMISIGLGDKVLSNVTITVTDVLGNTIKEITMASAQGTLQGVLDISTFANGVYLVRISSRELTAAQRLIKQ